MSRTGSGTSAGARTRWSGIFAGICSRAENAAVVLSLRGAGRIHSATLIKSMENAADRLRRQGILLVLCGVDERLYDQLVRTRAIDALGDANVLRTTSVLLESLAAAPQDPLLPGPQSRRVETPGSGRAS